MIKLNIHSIVDVITNSSTVIYTFQDSITEAKELLQEILNLIGSGEKVDDLFYFDVFLSDVDYYVERMEDYFDDGENDEDFPKDWPEDWKEQRGYVERLQEKIMKGEIRQPNWMKSIYRSESSGSTSLHIIPKDDKHKTLVDKMLRFLNSTYSEESYD